jgi:ParB/RepB/Spo0J family partition protein
MRELRRQKRRDLYVNPLTKAYEYKKMIERKNLTQSQLAKELGVSRVRVTQMLNLLTLPIEQQNYILEHGKEKFITERSLRRLVAEAKQRSVTRKNE